MKRKTGFLFAWLFIICMPLFAQPENSYSEKIFLHTDRDYYISGEDIRFKAYINPGEGIEIQSRVLYIELKDVVQDKIDYLAFLINENQVSGKIHLADSLRSGSYTLSAFTNWHKNFENRYAFRKELILINRFGTAGPMTKQQTQPPATMLPTPENLRIKDSLSSVYISLPGANLSDSWNKRCEVYSKGSIIWDFPLENDPANHYLTSLDKNKLPEGIVKIVIRTKNEVSGTAFFHNTKESQKLSVETDRATYPTRSPVHVSFSLQGITGDISTADLSVSVFPVPDKYPIQTTTTISDWFNLYSEITPSSSATSGISQKSSSWVFDELRNYTPKYPIEADGRIISGQVISAKSETPVSGALVFFSFMDTLSYLDYDRTDSLGYFYFNVPSGMHCDPGIIQVWQLPDGIDKFRISFEDQGKIMPPKESALKEVSGEELTDIFATQVKVFELSKLFEERSIPTATAEDPESYFRAIYAGYNMTVYPSDFISLYNFREIAKEILPGVQLRTEEDGISLRIMDESRNIYFDNDPLVLVNGLPLKSYNFLATLSSDDIEQIDIVRRLFVAGALVFPGVLSIRLKGGIKPEYLEANKLYQVNSEIISQTESCKLPDETNQYTKSKRQPDLRNTLLWMPELKIDSSGKQVLFYTADQEGKYRIRVEGLVDGTIPVSATHEFTIEANY